jgi:cytochrome c
MNTMEVTKIFGALCGSLLVFLLIQTAAGALFYTGTDAVAFQVEVEGAEGGDEAPAEEEAVDVEALMASADAGAGETVFRRCGACHVLEAGANRVGPYLHGVVGRDIAAAEGFSYSGALSGLEGQWTHDELFGFLANPQGYAPGTSMNFAGLSSAEDRANVIAYMEQASQ